MKVLILPDIHGRTFWKLPIENIEEYEKVIFLGDYFDPYDFEHISVQDAIENFKEIIELKKKKSDKIVLLLGNHCLPYYSDEYYKLSSYHCRHSETYHQEIHDLYNENKDLFDFAYVINDILFTHAGVNNEWLRNEVKCYSNDINVIANYINNITDMKKFFKVSYERGGNDNYGSCVWTDVNEMIKSDTDSNYAFKQVFGHTLQAFYNKDFQIEFGKPIEYNNWKMLDCARAFELDTENFKIKEV